MLGKRFMFGIIAIFCVSVTSVLLKYTGEIYIKLVWGIVGVYVGGQTLTDFKTNGGSK